jgi:RHS repeat-associated protein
MRREARMKNRLANLVIGLVVVANCLMATAQAATASTDDGSLWLATVNGASRIAVADGEIERQIPTDMPADAIAVHPASGDTWLLSSNVLHHYDHDGEQLVAVPLPVDGSMLASILRLDATRNSIWVADPFNVFRYDLAGNLQQSWASTGSLWWAGDLDSQGRLWLATDRGAWVVDTDTGLQEVINDPSLSVTTVAFDAVRDGIWLVGGHGAALYSPDGVQQVVVPVNTVLDALHAQPDGNGGLWVTDTEIAVYTDATDNMTVFTVPFSDITTPSGSPASIRSLLADDSPGSVWMAAHDRVRRLAADGTVTRDIQATAAGSIMDIAKYRDDIAPEIRFEFPEDHTTSSDPRLSLGFSFSDIGDGIDSDLLQLQLNAQPLATTCTTDTLTAECVPEADLPEGTHYLTATIADLAGNVSEPAGLHLSIESAGPQIDTFTPQSAPVGTRVTLTGRNFDPLDVAGNRITFNGAEAIVVGSSETEMQVIVPLAATTGPISITNQHGEFTTGQHITIIPGEDFAIDTSNAEVLLPPGGFASTLITLASLGLWDYAQLVDLQFSGLPEGITASLDLQRLSVNRPVTLTLSGNAPPGTYTVNVLATGMVDGQMVTREIAIQLTILPEGTTSLGGRILHADDDRPFVGALVQLGDEIVETDSTGSYLFIEPELTGDQVVIIDGHTNNTEEVHYASRIAMPVMIESGLSNRALTSYMSAVNVSEYREITPGEKTDVTMPSLPDYALNIPEGAILMGWDGTPIDKINVRTIPPDRLPIKPIPEGVTTRSVYLYYFFREGGANPSEPIPVTMRNDLDLLPGEKVDLWYYDESITPDPDSNQWRIMGQGTVSEDGLSIISDPGVGIPKFCCGATFPSPPAQPEHPPGGDGDGACAGNPVDVASGIGSVMDDHTLGLNGVFPVEINCGYSSNSEREGPFGTGTWMNYEWRLLGGGSSYTVVTPRGIRYTLSRQPDGSYRANGGRAGGQGMVLHRQDNRTAVLVRKDGSRLEFGIGGQRSNPLNTLLLALEDASGNRITLSREVSMSDTNGRLIAVTDANGRHWRLDYASTRRISAITDSLGRVQTYEYVGPGRLAKVTDPAGNVTEYEWPPEFIEQINPINCEERGVPCHIDIIPNPAPRRITAKNRTNGARTEYLYDSKGRVKLETLANGGEYRFDYDLIGDTVTGTAVTNPRGSTSRYRFNGQGYETRHTDALGRVFEKNYDFVTNVLRSKTDDLGRKTFYTYDERGNRTSVRNPADHVRVTDYHPQHNKPTRLQDELGRESHLTYDTNGNIKTVTNPENETTTFTHDERGLLTAITNPLGHTTEFAYDSEGNLTRLTDPLGNRWHHDYDLANRKIAETDPLGRTTHYDYDAIDRLVRITDASGGVTDIAYTSTGKLETVTDAKGAVIETNTYDLMGNLKTRTDSQGRTHHYDYDLNNNLTRHTDPKGQVTNYSYDALDRLTRIIDADGRTTQYHYDLGGRLVLVHDTVSGETRYTYDILDRLTRELTDRGMIEYQYDAANQLTRRILNGSDVTDYEYDNAGRLTEIRHTAPSYAGATNEDAPSPIAYGAAQQMEGEGWGEGQTQEITFKYDTAGQMIAQTGSNGITQAYTYDSAGRLTEIVYTSPDGEELDRIDYDYDPSGHIVTRNRTGGSDTNDAPFTATYDEDNRLLTVNDHPLTYDDNGNLIERETESGKLVYEYNSDNRLRRFERWNEGESQPVIVATYEYDREGRRTQKTVTENGTEKTVNFTWEGTRLIEERDADNRLIKSYRYGLGYAPTQVIDLTGVYPVHTDHLDTPQYLTDQQGNVVWRANYTAYGSVELDEDPDGDGNAITFNIRFPGQYEDTESGLYYNHHRYYDPKTGRYITSDPIGLRGGLNSYAYAAQDPISNVDPLGLDAICGPGRKAVPLEGHESDFPKIANCVIDLYEDPNKKYCATAECAAGISPNPNYSENAECQIGCNVKYQLVCSGAGVAGTAAANVAAGAAAAVGCMVVKFFACKSSCDDDNKNPDEPKMCRGGD